MQRQTEAARIIAKGAPVNLGTAALTEIDYGLWEGLTTEAITAEWPTEYANWTEKSLWADGIFGSSLEIHLQNIESWLTQLREAHSPGDTVLALTSNGVIRLFYAFEPQEWNRLQQLGQMESLKVKTGHFCELLLYPDSLQIKTWNRRP